jgi:mTERF
MDVVRNLSLKYPYILSKTERELASFFEIMERNGLTEDETIKALIECPKLISKNLDHQIKEIFFLFNLYHGIKEKDVMEIFKSFPFLFCCDVKKF